MNFLTRLFGPTEQKLSRAYRTHFLNAGRAAWSGHNYQSYAREAYALNVIAHSAINRIANAVSAIEWQVKTSTGIVDQHPLIDLINRPNPAMSRFSWWKARVSYQLLSGNSYDERVYAGSGSSRRLELWPLRPDRMTIIPGPNGLPKQYEYKVGHNKVLFPVDARLGSDILHVKLFHPTDDWYGMSPISAGAYSVDQHNESMNWVQSLLQNAARPSGALIHSGETALSDEEYQRMKAELEQKYQGSENAGRPLLLEGGLDWKEMGLSPMDMEILKTKESSARDISLAFGVPPLLLNIPGDNTYANYREARLGFYEDTILPLVDHQAAELSYWLAADFPNAELVPNKDKIEAIADKRTKMWEMADNSDDLTLNESRAIKGYDPLPDPLGSTLMSEIRKGQSSNEEAAEDEAVQDQLRELGYGKVD